MGVETMPKNIVPLSDGTGNSSAKLFTTNVWRLYQALDLGDPALQVGFYDNGVGTSSFKPLAILGGIFGYGLKRNVIALYSFLCRNYHPHEGDRIFGFGFSRGAFTIRIVAGLVAHEWLVPYTGDEAKLARNAKAAYRQYRERFTTTARIEVPFRWIYHSVLKFFNPPVLLKQRHQSRNSFSWSVGHCRCLWRTNRGNHARHRFRAFSAIDAGPEHARQDRPRLSRAGAR
jgi:type VI secretion system (T6SS) phospholipase Tle1-like effector